MKCPDCKTDLAPAKHHGVDASECASCHGLWLTREELNQLEDETFDLGDEEKGTLVFRAFASPRACPECGAALKGFQYRLYDLELEYCEAGHGFWLDADEDDRVLKLMKEEEARLKRSGRAEHTWAGHLRRFRSGSFLEKLRELLR